MRRITFILAIAVIAISSISAQDLNKIMNDHYKASASEKMSKITSITTTGKNTLAAMGMETGFTLYQARPSKIRVEADFAGQKIIQTYDGTTGWMYAPAMGITQPQQLGTAELKSIVDQAQIDSPLWDYKSKGKQVELVGVSEDGSANLVKVISADESEMTLHIDKKSSLISKVTSVQNAGGTETVIEVVMKDYKDVKGIPTAHYMTTSMGGQLVATITFESVNFNEKLDPALFEKPVIE